MSLRHLLAIAAIFAVLFALAPGARTQTPPVPSAADSVGSVSSVTAPASVTRNARATPLKVGDDIFQNDVLTTGAGGALGITFDDETTFTLSANSSITVNDFIYQQGGSGNKAVISVVRGTAAFFASQVAKTGDMKINTPTATLGIRGTSGVIEVPDAALPGAQEQVKLYPDSDRKVGRIEVFGRDGSALGTLTQGATGFGIARGAARLTATPLIISAQQIAFDRGIVARVHTLQQGVGRQMINQRIQRIPELQRRLNPQNLRTPNLQQPLQPKPKEGLGQRLKEGGQKLKEGGIKLKEGGIKLKEEFKEKFKPKDLKKKTEEELKNDQLQQGQIRRAPEFPRSSIPSGPGGGFTPRLSPSPRIGR